MSHRRVRPESERLSSSTRWGLAVLAAGFALGFAVSRTLEPSPRGFGTHTQLGLPPCQFAWVTGRPCPSCGMTTSFAWFVRGRFDRSFGANPGGLVMATGCAALIPWLIAAASSGRTPGFRSAEFPLLGLVVVTVAACLVSWTVRLVFF